MPKRFFFEYYIMLCLPYPMHTQLPFQLNLPIYYQKGRSNLKWDGPSAGNFGGFFTNNGFFFTNDFSLQE
jgi:hypothetical protein